MFTWLNKQGVRSDQGFVVQVIDRFTMSYQEAEQAMNIPMELGMSDGAPCVVIDPHALVRWDGSPPSVTIPLEKQQEILNNLTEALKFQNVKIRIEGPER